VRQPSREGRVGQALSHFELAGVQRAIFSSATLFLYQG